MRPLVIITPAAELDIAEAIDWYEATCPGLSTDFRRALDDTLSRITDHPSAYTLIARGVRRALLRRFPHGVFYRPLPEAIQVVGVLHPSRDPSIWQVRNH